MNTLSQPGILDDVPAHARYMTFRLAPGASSSSLTKCLASLTVDSSSVVGFGSPVASRLGVEVAGLRDFPHLAGDGHEMPATPGALWVWLRGADRGELLHQGRAVEQQLAGVFELEEVTDGFRYGASRDLTGYEDGTENPEGDEAIQAALVTNAGDGLNGSSFVAVQKWVHDLSTFGAMSVAEQDATFGRRISDNEEIDDAPESAHVKRTAQEDFDPEAFVVRRSMPWADGSSEGLVFVAFGASFDAYEALARQMLGLNDGITDALFRFTRPITGNFYWCPPVRDGRLDLRGLGVS